MHTSSQSAVLIPPPAPPPVMPPPVQRWTKSPQQTVPHQTQPRWRADVDVTASNANRPLQVQGSEAAFPTISQTAPRTKNGYGATLSARVADAWRIIRKTQQRFEDAPAWLVSLCLHLVFLLILALISTSSAVVGQMVLTLRQADADPATELMEISIETAQWSALPTEEPTESVIDLPPVIFDAPLELASMTPKGDVNQPSSQASLDKPPGKPVNLFAGRSGPMKQMLLQQAGGTEETELAVKLGLQWLKRQQQRDGSWSLRGPYQHGARSENDVAATAMAMLAFMGAGSTHLDGDYQQEVSRAVRWLVKQQDRQGFMAARAASHERMYAQAQAMIALCELYAMTGDSWIRPYAQLSCDFACRAQSPQGGWRYLPRFDSDTSVTGWFVMGLKSGQAAGLEVNTAKS
ncbi:terpene cyclase/mutase family protein, partial [Stieleria sp. TO1_6]|uniref:prenyltransferase/squalene oxidase repeat-containing protein n=1 Tax=Stieleria tagensis TaxID=2956795 RepID=UPI00209B0A72